MSDISVNLATGYKNQGYADPFSVEIAAGDRIIFHSIDSSFKVTFSTPATMENNLNNTSVYIIPLGQDKETEKFASVLPSEAEYKVEILSVADNNKGQAKMTVKAIIPKTRWKPNS